jgi:L-asparaginase
MDKVIQIITTGGTIDKVKNESGELGFGKDHIEDMLKQANITVKYQIDKLMQKDSLDMTEADRDTILKECHHDKQEKIIITHGTDTMTQTAKYLSCMKHKTVVLTGAMIPYSEPNSDALFNLGAAFIAVQHLPHGVYIAMNGKVFSIECQKNKDLGVFEEE